MGDDSVVISESDIFVLKETLHEQQQLLQKLYSELDAEREASASAASEALSVILRLQSDKAAIKMESEQYKRMSEHKICHAEESLAIIEDIIYHKEMEVEALEHQLQAYRYQLLNVGCVDDGETSFQTLLRKSRSISLPLKNDYKVDELKGKDDMSDQMLDLDKKIINTSNIQFYWEQIRRLGYRVKEIAGDNCTNSMSEGNSGDLSNYWNRTPSQFLEMAVYNSNSLATANETEELKRSPNPMNNEAACDYPSSPSVHDVFEVPWIDQSLTSPCGKNKASASNGSGKNGAIYPEEAELLDHAMKRTPNWLRKKVPRSARHKRKLHNRNHISFIHHSTFMPIQSSTTKSLPVSSQLNITSEITEVEMPAMKESTNKEELQLLHEIKEQLKLLQDEVWSWKKEKKKKKHFTREEGVSLHSLQEAMLHFWF